MPDGGSTAAVSCAFHEECCIVCWLQARRLLLLLRRETLPTEKTKVRISNNDKIHTLVIGTESVELFVYSMKSSAMRQPVAQTAA